MLHYVYQLIAKCVSPLFDFGHIVKSYLFYENSCLVDAENNTDESSERVKMQVRDKDQTKIWKS